MSIWISHRGIRLGSIAENTKESFAAAVQKGFKWLETDLRLTADHHVVLAHDSDFSRLSTEGRPILKLTRAQLEGLTLGEGQRPLFLDEFLELHAKQSWVFDLKAPDSHATIGILTRMLQERLSMDEIVKKTKFVTWSKADEDLLRERLPGADAFARESECWRTGLSMIYFGGICAGIQKGRTYSLPPELRGRKLFTKDLVARFHARGARLIAFLPRTEAEAKEAAAAGFDEILSDGWLVPSKS